MRVLVLLQHKNRPGQRRLSAQAVQYWCSLQRGKDLARDQEDSSACAYSVVTEITVVGRLWLDPSH